MTIRARAAIAASALLLSAAVSSSLAAQAAPPKAPVKAPAKPAMDHGAMDHGADHSKMHAKADNHAASGWKELDAYHMLMMATWHPAKDKSDMAPFRAKGADMVASAKLLSASTPPKGCDTPALKKSAADLHSATSAAVAMIDRKSTDAELKTALGELHEKFEVLEEGCKSAK
ncbi:MAG TPA: hypothetical protein VE869_08785 [Gemmatimonas sp.]|nr:hypothetical protein [Gemmatimonas sp.]